MTPPKAGRSDRLHAPMTQQTQQTLAEYMQIEHTDAHIRSHLKAHGMRTTLNIDDDLVEKAAELTGIKEGTSLVRLGLESLIARESARRFAKLGGTEQQLVTPRHRRTRDA